MTSKYWDPDWESFSNKQLIATARTAFSGLERIDLLNLVLEFARRLEIVQNAADKF